MWGRTAEQLSLRCFEEVHVVETRERAILVEYAWTRYWVPRSVLFCHASNATLSAKGDRGTLTLPAWFADQCGISKGAEQETPIVRRNRFFKSLSATEPSPAMPDGERSPTEKPRVQARSADAGRFAAVVAEMWMDDQQTGIPKTTPR